MYFPQSENIDIFLKYSGIIFGILFSLIYLFKKWKKSSLPEFITMFLCAGGLSSGIELIIISFNELCLKELINQIYLVIGGIAIIWTCMQTILKILNHKEKIYSPY